MGDLFFNKILGVIIGGILAVLIITELGHMLVKSHAPEELTAENTAYPVDWAAIESGSSGSQEAAVEEGPRDYGLLLANADISAGERVARRCQSCHNFERGAANSTGPHLWDVVGRSIASVEDFNYSAALQDIGGVWDYAHLDAFIERPAGYAPGTAMSFAGLRDETQRINLIAYLRSLSDSPMALPAPLASDDMDDAAEAAEGPETDMAAAEDTASDDDTAAAVADEPAPAEEPAPASPEDGSEGQ
jgi:cytochrome c